MHSVGQESQQFEQPVDVRLASFCNVVEAGDAVEAGDVEAGDVEEEGNAVGAGDAVEAGDVV